MSKEKNEVKVETEEKIDKNSDTDVEASKDKVESNESYEKDETIENKDETSQNEGESGNEIDSEKKIKKIFKKKNEKKPKAQKAQKKPEDVNIVKELLSLIVYIGVVVLLCYFIIHFVGCRSRVDGSSMNPTLNNGDNLWVDKLSYTFGDPDRFDVIIFNYDEDTTYVKRIIGLPGETVRIDQNGCIYINEQLLKENYGNEQIFSTNIGRASQSILLEEDEYFVLGDNRNNSSDSRRADVGNVKREDIVGKVILRIYPLSDIGIVK